MLHITFILSNGHILSCMSTLTFADIGDVDCIKLFRKPWCLCPCWSTQVHISQTLKTAAEVDS